MNVSIVIPTYNSVSTIEDTVKACLVQDYPREKLEIIVVDDGSRDGTGKILERYPVRYIYQDKRGPAAARNNGWRNSKGDAVCFTDADCVPCRNWVSLLIADCDKENIGAVAGSYAVTNSPYLLDKFIHYEIKYRHSRMSRLTTSFGTYNVLIKRSVLEELGGFDEGYSNASGEDSDLSYRIIKAGYKIYFKKEALVKHYNILRLFRYLSVQFRHGYWRMKLYRRNASMIARDEYGYWKDFTELLLGGMALVLFVFTFKYRFLITGAALTLLLVMQIPLCVRIFLREGDVRYIFFSVVTFIRIFVRFLGGAFGLVRFWILKK